ncbi:HdeD family acid-resistance protein [uncultured Mameliella sp.]|uniref:HdeD family acid-resistance protein n=1 Tax=uncultured Mameliella sp. TaxID=1447087 RepID=UPI002636CFC7|nr:HdeD family acid-resistance protein [uncultured Mameliella sp.]
MTDSDPKIPVDLKQAIRENESSFRWLGIVLIVLGVLAILFPLVASIAAKVMLGWFLLITGAVMLWHAFQARSWRPALWLGLIGALQLAVGVYLAFFPLTGLIGLTVLLAMLFLVQGGIELALAWQHRPGHGMDDNSWIWLGLSGAITILLALLLMAGLPGTALWALGLLIGLNFLSSGISFVMLAGAARTL